MHGTIRVYRTTTARRCRCVCTCRACQPETRNNERGKKLSSVPLFLFFTKIKTPMMSQLERGFHCAQNHHAALDSRTIQRSYHAHTHTLRTYHATHIPTHCAHITPRTYPHTAHTSRHAHAQWPPTCVILLFYFCITDHTVLACSQDDTQQYMPNGDPLAVGHVLPMVSCTAARRP